MYLPKIKKNISMPNSLLNLISTVIKSDKLDSGALPFTPFARTKGLTVHFN